MDASVINACFETLLGRAAQEHELAHFGTQLQGDEALSSLLKRLLDCEEFRNREQGAPEFVPGGHFYSAVPSDEDIRKALARSATLESRESIPGVDCDTALWMEHLESIRRHAAEADFPETRDEAHRYFYENPAYSYGDALSLFAKLLDLRPARIVEVGSGYSSALMLDTIERQLGGRTEVTFVEPYPQVLKSLLRPSDLPRCEVLETGVQEVAFSVFDRLRAGDILFIDSTHVAKLGSDVNFLFFEVLPRLAPGVRIHVHDIFWPFEYPANWIAERRAWNEAYLLRALLSGSRRYKIEYFSSYMNRVRADWIRENVPLIAKNPGGHLWMAVQP
jgi:hypothetical protein